MPFNLGLLSDAGMADLPEATRDELQKQATKQFLIGSLLGGDPSMAFRSAIDVPNQYVTSQQRQLALEKAREEQAQLDRFRSQFTPTPTDAAGRAMAGGGGPTIAAAEAQKQILNAPIDIDAALKATLGMSGNSAQTRIVENLKAMQPQFRPEIGAFTTAGGKVSGTVPLSDKSGMTRQYNAQTGRWEFGTGIGAPQTIETLGAAEARGAAAGQVEKVWDSASGQYKYVPRSALLGGNQPNVQTPGVGGAVGTGGFAAEPSPAEVTLNKAADQRYQDFSKNSGDSALTANDRKLAGERIYSLADSINGTKFTNLTSEAAGYLRALPWVGDKFDSYVADVSLFNRDRANMVLRGLGNVKGNANESENRVVSQASVSVTDPKVATKYVAALEMAAADKDLARQNFVENYRGDPGKIQTAWQNSPDNPRIYNHPKVDQFLTEQIKANPAKPLLPAGFSLVQNKDKQYGVRKPDGSVMPLQLGR